MTLIPTKPVVRQIRLAGGVVTALFVPISESTVLIRPSTSPFYEASVERLGLTPKTQPEQMIEQRIKEQQATTAAFNGRVNRCEVVPTVRANPAPAQVSSSVGMTDEEARSQLRAMLEALRTRHQPVNGGAKPQKRAAPAPARATGTRKGLTRPAPTMGEFRRTAELAKTIEPKIKGEKPQIARGPSKAELRLDRKKVKAEKAERRKVRLAAAAKAAAEASAQTPA